MQIFCKPGILHSRHYPHVSAVVFSLLAFTVLGVGFPMLLLAQEIQGPMSGSPTGGAPMGAPTMSPPPGGQPGMQQGFGGQQGPNTQSPNGFGGQPNSQGFNQPGNMQGQQIDQGIRGVDKGIRIDQGIRGTNGQQDGQQGMNNQQGPNQMQGFGGNQGKNMQGQQGFGGPQGGQGMQGPNSKQGGPQGFGNDQGQGMGNDQGFGNDQGQGMGNDQQNGDQGGMSEKQQQQQDARQKQMEKQQLSQMKKGMKGMERGLSMFDKQIAKLTKQGIAVPTECADNLTKIKGIITAVKVAETFEAVQEAGVEDIQDSMQSLNDCRQQLEMLARWPRTIKQLNSEVKRLESALKRDKSIVAKLLKKEIDLSEEYGAFENAVSGIKAVRDEAISKIKSGDSEGAFSMLEEEFFGAMQDVWEKDRIIQTMSNLGRFTSNFKRGIADEQRTIKSLKRSKVDTSTLEDLLAQSQEKGQELIVILKTKPIDEDAVMSGLQELEDLRSQFDNARQELSGKEESRPWEQGPQQFKQLNSVDFSQFGIGGGQQSPQ